MLVTVTILDPIDKNGANAIRFLMYAADVNLSEAKQMVKENISWLIETEKTEDELRHFASDYKLDVAIAPAKKYNKVFCSFCDAEATVMVEESNMPLCHTCKEAFEYGQSRADYSTVEV